jgi:hypothetical protein
VNFCEKTPAKFTNYYYVLVYSSSNEFNQSSLYIIVAHLNTAFFKIVCGILEFLDGQRETVDAFDVRILIHRFIHGFILLFAWDMPDE